MRGILLFTAALILIAQADPSTAQAHREAGGRYEGRQHHRDAGVAAGHRPGEVEVLRRKPRVCHRPDIGRHARLIPYSC